MAIQRLPGIGVLVPSWQGLAWNNGAVQTSIIDATGEKVALIGQVWWTSRTGTKDIHKIQFGFGAVVKAGGSVLTLSLQDVGTTTAPGRPDETQDQTVTIANADANFVTSGWYTTAALSADRTVAYKEWVAVVIEYDGGGRLGADSVKLGSNAQASGNSFLMLKTGGTWAAISGIPNLVFEFVDGTFGIFDQGWPALVSTWSGATGTFNLNTAGADEQGMEFQLPFGCEVDGLYVADLVLASASSDFEIILYQGTTALATVSVDATMLRQITNVMTVYPITPVVLAANTLYTVAVRPTTTNNVTLNCGEVSAAAHQALLFNSSWGWNSRLNQGAWGTANYTRRAGIGVRAIGLDDGAGNLSINLS